MGADLMKKEIKRTFITMLNEKPLSQITVKGLVAECGINRNSFYYHYPDLPALIEEIVEEETAQIIAEYPTIDSIETALRVAVEFCTKNRRAILHMYNSVNRDIFERHLWKVCDYVVSEYGKTIFEGTSIRPLDREIIERFYRCECFGVAMEWLSEQMNSDTTKDIQRFCAMFRGMTEEMIRRSTLEYAENEETSE